MIKQLLNIIPRSIQKKIYLQVRKVLIQIMKYQSKNIPKNNLDEIHVKNTKLLKDRFSLLEMLPKNAVVAELGVDQGNFSTKILEICQPKKLHLVDVWQDKRYHQNKRNQVESRFESNIKNEQVEINIGLSTDVVSSFPDNYFDFIYIDTDHSYPTTLSELELYSSKMKKEGIICGHDYIIGYWNGMVRYGVKEAVAYFCKKYNWELTYLTAETNGHPSFAVKKIG